GADLCTPEEGRRASGALRIVGAQVARLESEIDRMNAALNPRDSFILPGGTPAATHLHLARTVTRRAERLVRARAAYGKVTPGRVQQSRCRAHRRLLRGGCDVLPGARARAGRPHAERQGGDPPGPLRPLSADPRHALGE